MMLVVKPESMLLQVIAVLLLVVPMGPLIYRLVYRPLAHATVLILLIVSVALHLVMVGLGLFFFGAEGSRTAAFSEARWEIGGMTITGQSLVSLVVVVALAFDFTNGFHDTGNAMAASIATGALSPKGAVTLAAILNRVGARLMGIPTALSGDLSFALAALIGAVSGLLIAPVTTIYYDTGFLIGLKGFVAAIVGGLGSYPLALAGARLYDKHCAQCHGAQGQGMGGLAYPPLAGNRAVTMAPADNLLQHVLYGGFNAATAGYPRPFGMPPFVLTLGDAEIAAVLSYVRTAWGNSASELSALEVHGLRQRNAPTPKH
jgi:cytochrome c553